MQVKILDPISFSRELFPKLVLDPDACILCGADTSNLAAERNSEHVFPSWYLKNYAGFDAQYGSVHDGKTFEPSKTKLRSCVTCNDTVKAIFDDTVPAILKKEVEGNYAPSVDEETLIAFFTRWTYYKERVFAARQRRFPDKREPLHSAPRKFIKSYERLFFLYYELREFIGSGGRKYLGQPSIFRYHVPADEFTPSTPSFTNSANYPCSILRVGSHGRIIVHDDVGQVARSGRIQNIRQLGTTVNFFQFLELYAEAEINRARISNLPNFETIREFGSSTPVYSANVPLKPDLGAYSYDRRGLFMLFSLSEGNYCFDLPRGSPELFTFFLGRIGFNYCQPRPIVLPTSQAARKWAESWRDRYSLRLFGRKEIPAFRGNHF